MNSLQAIDFLDFDNELLSGLVPPARPDLANGPHERAALLDAAEFEDVDYVYIRRFEPEAGVGRTSQVVAYVIDNTRGRLTNDDLAVLHHHLWLHAVGGIQRFKLGLHGRGVLTAAMVGYIEEQSPEFWLAEINRWIASLTEPSSDGCSWSDGDQLQSLDVGKGGVSTCRSSHSRTDDCVSPSVTIHHFWVSMLN